MITLDIFGLCCGVAAAVWTFYHPNSIVMTMALGICITSLWALDADIKSQDVVRV